MPVPSASSIVKRAASAKLCAASVGGGAELVWKWTRRVVLSTSTSPQLACTRAAKPAHARRRMHQAAASAMVTIAARMRVSAVGAAAAGAQLSSSVGAEKPMRTYMYVSPVSTREKRKAESGSSSTRRLPYSAESPTTSTSADASSHAWEQCTHILCIHV
eukprot:6203465-Pleurochrysis_carterae.AAC.2